MFEHVCSSVGRKEVCMLMTYTYIVCVYLYIHLPFFQSNYKSPPPLHIRITSDAFLSEDKTRSPPAFPFEFVSQVMSNSLRFLPQKGDVIRSSNLPEMFTVFSFFIYI